MKVNIQFNENEVIKTTNDHEDKVQSIYIYNEILFQLFGMQILIPY